MTGMEKILSGKPAMLHYVEQVKARVSALGEKGITPGLCVVWVGEDPSAESYGASIRRRGEMVGVRLTAVNLPASSTVEEVCACIDRLNADSAVHGVLLYLPLPGELHGHEDAICARLDPKKDVDGITAASAAALYLGEQGGFAPCTAEACLRLLEYYDVPLSGKNACVVGRSRVIGKPAAMLLLAKNATVTVAHSRTPELAPVTREADVLIAAAGCAGLITGEHVKPGAVVVDVGANWQDGKMVGDVLFDEAEAVAGAITPVPGGVGMVTSTVLMEHVVTAAERAAEK